jgi:hypothetical protein
LTHHAAAEFVTIIRRSKIYNAWRPDNLVSFFLGGYMNRLRTINEAYNFLKEQDPGTSISPYFIRKMIVDGQVPSFKVGRKYLLDVDALVVQLVAKLTTAETPEMPATGPVRPTNNNRK